jgi:transcriptional regulator with XRE-family HTH domain
MSTIQDRLRALRKHLNLTQGAFGASLGLKDSVISRIESAKIPLTDKNIELICLKHNVRETWIRTGEGAMFRERIPEVQSLIDTYNQLSPPMRQCIQKIAHTLLESQ